MRAGLATSAAIAGKSERAIMNQTGHRSVATVRKYIRDGNLFRDNVAQGRGCETFKCAAACSDNKCMTDRRWRFQLDGNKVDINDLLDLFSDREQFTHDTQGRLCLQLPLPLASEDSAGAFEAATQHLARLNGIASIFHENHGPVKIGGGAYTDPETGKEVPIIAGVEGIPSGLRMGTNGMIIQEGCSPTAFEPFGDHVLKLAYQNEDLERALYLYGGTSHDWRGLYMVLEAIEDGNGGERRLIQRGWAPDGAIKRLKDTANSFRAIGLQARHGSNTIGSNSPKQTLEEAKALIRNLLDCWIKDLRRRSAEGSSTLANGAGK